MEPIALETKELERDVERYLKKRVEALGGLCIKWQSPTVSGVPDRVILMPKGFIYFVEVKTKKGRLTARQKLMHTAFRRMGSPVLVVRGKDGVDAFTEKVLGYA